MPSSQSRCRGLSHVQFWCCCHQAVISAEWVYRTHVRPFTLPHRPSPHPGRLPKQAPQMLPNRAITPPASSPLPCSRRSQGLGIQDCAPTTTRIGSSHAALLHLHVASQLAVDVQPTVQHFLRSKILRPAGRQNRLRTRRPAAPPRHRPARCVPRSLGPGS